MPISAILAVLGTVSSLHLASSAQGCERIDLSRPAQFITFERSGLGKPVYVGESAERVWLRLSNNTTCPIQVYGGRARRLADGSFSWDPANGEETPLEYDIYDALRRGEPRQWAGGNTHTQATIAPGFSVVFQVPTSHFKNGSGVAVPFVYAWEDGAIRRFDLRHYVYLLPEALPENLRGRLKRSR
jgi:hypothetical protein